jgi:phosphopantothenoylcysteine decarboxylase/phosphopantothenate--cysteine ligase
LITAGPTFEPIDAVRFIGNYSSGKMGFALAEVCAEAGAKVFLISGPVSLKPVHQSIEHIPVRTAEQMLEACLKIFKLVNGAILSAAVADYRPASPVSHKIKSKDANFTVEMVPNPDIAATLGALKKPGQVLVGFALETDNEISNAIEKLSRKNFDFIVLNSLRDEGSGFNSDTNKITIIGKDNKILSFELKPKREVAFDILQTLVKIIQ